MSALVIPVQFANLVSATPQQLDQNFAAIASIINGKLDSTNLSFSPATLDGSSLLQQNAPAGFTIGGFHPLYSAGVSSVTTSSISLSASAGDIYFYYIQLGVSVSGGTYYRVQPIAAVTGVSTYPSGSTYGTIQTVSSASTIVTMSGFLYFAADGTATVVVGNSNDTDGTITVASYLINAVLLHRA